MLGLGNNSNLTVDQEIEALKLLDGGLSDSEVSTRFSIGMGSW